MANKLRSKDFKTIGITSNKTISIAMSILKRYYKRNTIDMNLELIKKIKETPEEYMEDEILGSLALEFHNPETSEDQPIPVSYTHLTLPTIYSV